jgi:hypothetical protein
MGAANATAASQIAQSNAYGNAANTLGNIGYGYAQQNMNQNLAGNSAYNNNYTSYDANATGGGNFTPTAGNSFTLG